MKVHKNKRLIMKTILVTGGAKRIGKSIVNSLAEENNQILIHYNNSIEEAQKLRDSLIKKKVNAQIYKADLSNSNQIMKMIDQEVDGLDYDDIDGEGVDLDGVQLELDDQLED